MSVIKKYKPECLDEKDNELKSVEIEMVVPTYDERLKYIDESGFAALAETAGGKDADVDLSKAVSSMRYLAKELPKHIKSISVKKKDGEELKSLEEVSCDVDCDPLLRELGMVLIHGFKPSKKRKAS